MLQYSPSRIHLDIDVSPLVKLQVEMGDLGAQACLHLDVHLVARLHQLQGQLHVILRQPIVGTQRKRARQETHQVVLRERARKPD